MEGLTFRKACPADTDRIAEIMFGEPRPEAIRGIGLGRIDRVRAIGRAYVRMPGSPKGWQWIVVAELDDEVVGVMQAGASAAPFRPSRLVLQAIRIYGIPDVFQLLQVVRADRRVQTDRPAGEYHVFELHVDSRYRNRGIGAALLRYAEEDARKGGHRLMSLQVLTSNPARRLYERAGFRVTDTRTDPDFERFTGAAGAHRMVKDLD